MAILAIYALLEFYPVNSSLNALVFNAVLLISIAYCFVFTKQIILDEVNILPAIYLGSLLAYSLLSFLWAPDKHEVLTYSMLLFRNAGIFIVFSALFRKRKIQQNANWFYLFVLLLYLTTALWEMFTWKHLPSSRYHNILTFIPCGPFYGENILAAFMLMILPVLLFTAKMMHGWLLRLLSGLAVLSILVIITVQGARIALIAAGGLLAFVWIKYTSLKSKLLSVLMLLLLVWGAWHFAGTYVKVAWSIFGDEMLSIGSEGTAVRMSSVKTRKQLIIENLDILSGSSFMGVGAGNVEHYMATDRSNRTGGITNPHNYILELMSNFGLGFMLAFISLYLMWLYRLYRAASTGDPAQKSYYLMYFFVLLMFIPAGSLPSSIKWNHLIWILFAHINLISHPHYWQLRNNEEL